ncbi:Zn(II)2Cys6 transcription factor [Aspergillus lucknowensis]|uniref:Fungal-specific transcription factor domain-containing protein n=1 Tax=Aspergillus lucknowensis TaxID=176173 RepID=A0ABR4LD74_9EURO
MHPSGGCLPCKSRKKKCDGANPICRACQRNYLVCVWPAGHRPKSKGVPSSALSIFAVDSKDASSRRDEPNAESDPAPPRAKRLPAALSSVPGALSATAHLSRESKFLLDHYLHRTGKMASAHVGTYTPFTDALLPIADASTMLLDSILAFSSFHLATTGSNVSPVSLFEQQGLALRTLKYGITQYSHGDKDAGIQVFLSMLMLCCVELANGGQSESSFQHLAALRNLAPGILGSLPTIPQDYKTAVVFGRELYAYFLAVACICDPASMGDPTTIEEFDVVFSEIISSGCTGALLGCSDALFVLIPQAVAFLHEARALSLAHPVSTAQGAIFTPDSDAASSSSEAATLKSKTALLLTKVSLWEPPVRSDITFQVSGRILQLALTSILVETSYWCNVATVSASYDPGEPLSWSFRNRAMSTLDYQMAPLMTEFVGLLESLPAQSWIATTMCWSIVVLGSYATLPHHRNAVRRYLLDMEATFKFQNMTRSRLLLEYIWSRIRTFDQDRPIPIVEAMIETGGRFMLG